VLDERIVAVALGRESVLRPAPRVGLPNFATPFLQRERAVIQLRIAGGTPDQVRGLVRELVKRRGLNPLVLAEERRKQGERYAAMGRRSQAHAKVRRARAASGR
jgi:hypothetical protein